MTDAPQATESDVARTALIVLHEPVLGGATRSILRLLPDLGRRGWRFRFWAPRPSEVFDHLEAAGFEVHGAPRPVVYSLRALRLPPGPGQRLRALPGYLGELRALSRERRPAIAHLNSLDTLAEAAVIRSAGVPVVAHVHEMVAPTVKGRLARAALRAVASEVIAVSTASAAALAAGGWTPRIVHEAAPAPATAPDRDAHDPERPLIGTVGVIAPRKGSDLFVEAARIVRAERPGARFQMVGAPSDPLERRWADGVLAAASEAGIEHIPAADVGALLTGWDVFALPSRRDPFPIAMLEAMGSGLAVVGSRIDGIPEQLAGGAAGELVDPGSPQALAEAIIGLLDDPERRRRLGEAARARVLTEFTLERQAAGVEATWLEAAKRGGA